MTVKLALFMRNALQDRYHPEPTVVAFWHGAALTFTLEAAWSPHGGAEFGLGFDGHA